MVISGKSLTVHAVPGSILLYRLLWTGDGVLAFEVGVSHDPYRFRDVQNALVFLDALLMHYVARMSSAAAAVGAATPHVQNQQAG